jgi:hypothetical protein
MGPNALPVPEIADGRIDSMMLLNISYDYYSSPGDKTHDVYLKGILPLFDNKVSVELSVVPLEWYKMDTITRDLRAVRTESGEGSAGGDIYVTTNFQILRNKNGLPDINLRYSLKTASGTHLRDARYTDAPGYSVDLSFGKSYLFGIKQNQFRWFLNSGLYVYQTYDVNHSQNDCFFYGGGFFVASKKIKWSNEIGGYAGYFNNGDHPLVLRSHLKFIRKILNWELAYQNGLHDFEYDSYRISMIFEFDSKVLR